MSDTVLSAGVEEQEGSPFSVRGFHRGRGFIMWKHMCVDAFEKPQWIVSGNNDQKNLHLCKFQLLEFRLGYIV